MFTELIDLLRCPNLHEDSWLVATSTRTADRHIMEGKLGCPVCRATYAIAAGEVLFAPDSGLRTSRVLDDDAAFRLAAQLHLVDAPKPVLLMGRWSAAVRPLRAILPGVTMFVGNTTTTITPDERVSGLRFQPAQIPVAAGALRGLAIDDANIGVLGDAARVLGTAGRLVAPVAVTLDEALWRTLATDADVIVAERLPASSAPIPLRRAPSAPLFEA